MARVYFDSSAVMRFLVRRRGGNRVAQDLWTSADQAVSAGITYVGVRAALAAGRRNRHWSTPGHMRLKQAWEEAWQEVHVVDADRPLLARAAALAEGEALRGYDAIQLASAEVSVCDVFVAADHRLCVAERHPGFTVVDLGQVEA